MDLMSMLVGAGVASVVWLHMWWTESRRVRAAESAFEAACRRADVEQESSAWFREHWEKVAQQNMDLSQQLATLRVDKFAVPEQRQFEKREDPEPLSAEIVEFLTLVDSAEAREIMEDEIEAMRNAGLSDTEIMSRIEKGDV